MRTHAHALRQAPARTPTPHAGPRPASAVAIRSLLHGPRLQPKLKIGAPNDPAEAEADRVADQIMRMPERGFGEGEAPISPAGGGGAPILQRKCAECEEEEKKTIQTKRAPSANGQTSPDSASAVPAAEHGGEPLSVGLRSFFEPRFERDFGQVRVHADGTAAVGARAVQARAYTIGNDVVFGAGQYSPATDAGKRLLAHELTHVVQQGGAGPRPRLVGGSSPSTTFRRNSTHTSSKVSDVIQRAGDPAAIPAGFPCPTDLTPGTPAGTDVLFTLDQPTITPAHSALLTTFLATWVASGGTDDILVHGYASTDGAQDHNWTLSCSRAQSVQAELIRLGIPAARINIVAHGESTDFGSNAAANRHAVVSTSPAGVVSLPVVFGILTPDDNFAGRSVTRFGVGEGIKLTFVSLPPRPATDFGGLEWHHTAGGGALTAVTNLGTATYTAPATADTVRLELRVAAGATAGRVVSTHAIAIVIPSAVRMTVVLGTAPNFGGWGSPLIPAGTWGVGFTANEFIDPKDVSFQGVAFSEGSVGGVVTPAGSFLSGRSGLVHLANPHGPGLGGNVTTGTPVNAQDGVWMWGGVSPGSFFGVPTCGTSDFLWAIPWLFTVPGGAPTPFAGGFTANQHLTSNFSCHATAEKATAGPVCRRIDGTTC